MFRFLYLVFICFSTFVIAQNDDEEESVVKVELQLIDYELEDKCENLSTHLFDALLRKPGSLKKKILAEESFGKYLKETATLLKSFDSGDVPYELKRNWTILTKSGDALLPDNEYNEKISFYNTNTEIKYFIKIPCDKPTGCTYRKEDSLDLLATSRNLTVLKGSWFESQKTVLSSSKEKFGGILKQVSIAAKENDEYNNKIYWEMLNEYDDAYSKAVTLWEEIEPLYLKLHEFVKKRLLKFYNITENLSEIPVYLLGSNFGTNWLNIADIVLPHPQILHDVNVQVQKMDIQEIYKISENLTKTLNLGGLGQKFWENSIFNMSTCKSHILSYCTENYSRLLTCKKANLQQYIQAHINAMKIALNNQDYSSIMRQNLRFSAVDEAIYGMGEIFAIDNLPDYGMLPEDVFKNENSYNNTMTSLLLKALMVLPRLPYYLLADLWRLEELENPTVNISKSWWQYRKKYQKVKGLTNLEYDFLEDENVLLNKPYLSKFFGTLIQFQIIEYHKNMLSEEANVVKAMGDEMSFISLVQDRSSKEWPYLINYQYGIYDVLSSSLIEYFRPLEEYLDTAPLEQAPIKITKATSKSVGIKQKVQKSSKYINKQNTTDQDQIQNDSASEERTKIAKNESIPKKAAQQTAMYVGLGILGIVFLIAFLYLHKKSRRKEPTQNNRRYDP